MLRLEKRVVDVLVVGTGGAGAAAASAAVAAGASVLVISKDPIVCSDSKISEGIITVRGSGDASETAQQLHDNVRVQGDDLSVPEVVQRFAQDSPLAYQWLREQGLNSPTDDNDSPRAMGIAMGGHTQARSVDHQNGGLDYAHACWNAINHSGQINYLEDVWLLDLFSVSDNDAGRKRVGGGLLYHATTGRLLSIKASAVVLAAGGVSTLYFPNTDTMRGNTGDSYAIAARAGAQLIDMEQMQFIPFAVAQPPSYQGLVVGEPVLAGALGVIRDKDGKVIKRGVMGKTRAQCAAAIARAVANGQGTDNGACYLDLTENTIGDAGRAYRELMNEKIPGILKIVRAAMGVDAARFAEPWEVKPSAHYLMGGVRANQDGNALDQNGESISGLYVAGQALGGLHGSNRLGSTSLAEAVIFGRRAGVSAASIAQSGIELDQLFNKRLDAKERTLTEFYQTIFSKNDVRDDDRSPITLIRELQTACWQGIGPARDSDGLLATLCTIHRLQDELEKTQISNHAVWNQSAIDFIECRNLLLVAKSITKSAMQRPRSLGAHVRLDENRTWLGLRLGRQRPFSTASSYDEQQGLKNGLQQSKISRPQTPLLTYLRVMAQQQAKSIALSCLARAPHRIRDAVLLRFYRKALGREHTKATTSAQTTSENSSS